MRLQQLLCLATLGVGLRETPSHSLHSGTTLALPAHPAWSYSAGVILVLPLPQGPAA